MLGSAAEDAAGLNRGGDLSKHRLAAAFACAAFALLAGSAAAAPARQSVAGAQGDPVKVARDWIRDNREALGLRQSDIADLTVSDSYTDADSGVSHVYFAQRHKGVEIFNALLNVTVTGDGKATASASRLFTDAAGKVKSENGSRSRPQAIEDAADYLGVAKDRLEVHYAELAYQPVGGTLVLSWEIEAADTVTGAVWNLRVDANSGTVVAQDALTDDVGSYTVFPFPSESPADGPRQTVSNPDVAPGSPWGWHDTNGAAGPEYTTTRGNNAYAYTDVDANNAADTGSSPSGGTSLTFNFGLDLLLAPSTYRPASVTNLFYLNNVIHDVSYNHGFTEAAGNFQQSVYGRGGKAADSVLAESQDGSGKNNANFSTPRDGFAPRMQMYEWTYPFPNTVTVGSASYDGSSADFGPQLTETGLTGTVVAARDGSGVATDACEALVGFTSGAIALVDRGTCSFNIKVKNAQTAGAKAVVVVNNNLAPAASMGGTDTTITIPSTMVSKADGDAIRSVLGTASLKRKPASQQQPARDSSLDAGVVFHEYTHGISNRLTGGPSKTTCLNNDEQMGEGWSDYFALVLTARADETATTSRGMGTYLTWEQPTGFGIRPTPYSTSMSVDPVTYGQLPSLAVPHGVGYAWASMLWDVYWNIVSARGFNPNIYGAWSTGGNNLALRLVTDGMKLQPCSPGFVNGRDAIVQADVNLTGGANKCAIWRGFAKRGLGVNASQGSSTSATDGREDFTVPAGC
jgi:extracellular elastinolytic metalloproteinase